MIETILKNILEKLNGYKNCLIYNIDKSKVFGEMSLNEILTTEKIIKSEYDKIKIQVNFITIHRAFKRPLFDLLE